MPQAVRVPYTYLWEFTVAAEQRAEFERVYGPHGDWAQLFRRAPGYLGTLLLRDLADPRRFVTADRWQSETEHRAFRAAFAGEYAELDARCEHLTTAEVPLGSFDAAGGG